MRISLTLSSVEKNVFWADSALRYGVSVCKDQYSSWDLYLENIFLIKKIIQDLEKTGYTWHKARLLNWLHRFYKNHTGLKRPSKKADTLSREREGKIIIDTYEKFLKELYR